MNKEQIKIIIILLPQKATLIWRGFKKNSKGFSVPENSVKRKKFSKALAIIVWLGHL